MSPDEELGTLKIQKDKKTKDKDQQESLILRRQGSFALLRCFYSVLEKEAQTFQKTINFVYCCILLCHITYYLGTI